jgi:zinc/manganese transport system substrate-binding protein
MRKLFSLLLCVACAPAWAALEVFACTPEWGALARELGGDKASVYTATTALQDPHRIEARPSLIARARRADLVVCAGAGCRSSSCNRATRESSAASPVTSRPLPRRA